MVGWLQKSPPPPLNNSALLFHFLFEVVVDWLQELSAAGMPLRSPHRWVHGVFLRPAYLHFYSWSSGLSMFSVASNHIALIMPKEHASKTPNIQAKYHINISLIDSVRLVEVIIFDTTTHHVKAISGIAQYNGHKDTGNDEHNV